MSLLSGGLIGSRIAGLLVERVVGSGGMGVVYRAVDPELGKAYAIKVLIDPEGDVELFEREAKLLTGIGHPGIVRAEGHGRLPDGRPYIVMELLEGQSLDARLAAGPVPIAEAVSVVLGVLEPLIAAHAAGVVHRDLKPSNIFLLGGQGRSARVKLVDFGVAKAGRLGPSTGKTKASMVAGTPQYMSPEQVRQLAPTPQSDLYALGATLMHLVTGSPPFPTHSWPELINAHLHAQPPRASSRVAGVPRALDTLIAQLLEKEPRDRPASAREVRETLLKLSSVLSLEPTAPTGAPLREPTAERGLTATLSRTFGDDWRWASAGVAGLALLGAVLAVVLFRPTEGASPERPASASPIPAVVEPPVVSQQPASASPLDTDFDAKMKAAIAHDAAYGRPPKNEAKKKQSPLPNHEPAVASEQTANGAGIARGPPSTDPRCAGSDWKQVAKVRLNDYFDQKASTQRGGAALQDEARRQLTGSLASTMRQIDAAHTHAECIEVLFEVDNLISMK